MRGLRIKAYKLFLVAFLIFAIIALSLPQASAKKPELQAAWTFMVYMDADNNLDPWADVDFDEMEQIGSTDQVNVIVLCDRLNEPAYIYKIVKGDKVLLEDAPICGDEVDMGSPKTVEIFLKYVIKTFPAKHYILDIWNHGNDFVGSCVDENPGNGEERGYLYHDELVEALQTVYSDLHVRKGKLINILSFDACLQGMIEVAYYYRNLVDYLVGSEGYISLEGYPYDKILEILVNNPSLEPGDFAKIIVDEYVDYYVKDNMVATRGSFPTLSAIDLSKIDQLVGCLNEFLYAIEGNIEDYIGAITAGRGKGILPWAEYGWEAYTDLYTLVETIYDSSQNEEIRNMAETLLNSIESTVYVNSSLQYEAMSTHGLGIYFPPSEAALSNCPLIDGEYYPKVLFATETEWLNFLLIYYSHRGQ